MNNEKREQQMMNAADRYADEVCDESCTGAQVAETINDFCAGWREADQHPHWISVEERLPPKTTDWANPKYFLGSTEEGGIHKMYRMGDPTICKDFENEQLYLHVTHWMPIVPPRKGD